MSTIIDPIRNRYNVMTDAILRIEDDFTWNILSAYRQWKYRASDRMISILAEQSETTHPAEDLAHYARRGIDPLSIKPKGWGRNPTQADIDRTSHLIEVALSGNDKEMRERISSFNRQNDLKYPKLEATLLNSVGVDPAAVATILSMTRTIQATGREQQTVRITKIMRVEDGEKYSSQHLDTDIDLKHGARWRNGSLLVYNLPQTIIQCCQQYIGKAMSDLITIEGCQLDECTITSVVQIIPGVMSFKIESDSEFLDADGIEKIRPLRDKST